MSWQTLLGNQNAGGRFAKMDQQITAENSRFIDTQVDQQAVCPFADRMLHSLLGSPSWPGKTTTWWPSRKTCTSSDRWAGKSTTSWTSTTSTCHVAPRQQTHANTSLIDALGQEMDTVQGRLTATLQKLDKAMGLTTGSASCAPLLLSISFL